MIQQDSQHGQTPPGQGYRPPGHPAHYLSPLPVSGQYPPPTNTLAILALTLAFSCWPLALVFARKQIRKTGENGHGLAVAGLIGYLLLGLVILAIITIVTLADAASGAGQS